MTLALEMDLVVDGRLGLDAADGTEEPVLALNCPGFNTEKQKKILKPDY